jgi:hypothetical protein
VRDFSVSFRTERFDYTSELPEDANAGNRFYGRDVAGFLAEGLSSPSFSADFLDEDWGWMVLGVTDDSRFVEIAVYNLDEGRTPGQNGSNEWGLWVRAFERRKWFWLLSRSHEIELPDEIARRLRLLLEDAGLEPVPWSLPDGTA